MRLLMLSALYPPFIGGVEQHVRNLSQAFALRGNEVSVATMASPGLESQVEDDGAVTVHRLRSTGHRVPSLSSPQGRPHAPPFPDPGIALSLRRLVEAEKPDVVHAHDWMIRSYLPVRTSDTPLVLTLHNYGMVCAKLSYIYRGAACSGPGFSKCLRCAADNYGTGRGMVFTLGNWAMQGRERSAVDMFVPVSNSVAVANDLAGQGLPHEVVPNFVPDDVADRWSPEDPAVGSLPDEPFWLYVGALSRNKGVHVLLEAYAGMENPPPLVLIGMPWPDTPARFPRNIHVFRGLPHKAVMAAWRRASLGIVPSIFPDPCPTVAMEAMACGVPLVASRIGGLTDLVTDGETGLLVEAGDAVGLRGALARVQADPGLASRMGAAALPKVRSFTASSVVERLGRIYAGVTETA